MEMKNGTMADTCKTLYGWVPPRYKRSNYFQTVYHSRRTGYIEKVIKDEEVYLRLTAKGNEKLKRDFSMLAWQKRRWDRKWRILVFDIAEKSKKTRDSLRRKLRELGFGMLQESVWVSPYDFVVDMREFLKAQGLEENAFIFETTSIEEGDNYFLATRIWPLEDINEQYERLFYALTKMRDRAITSEEELRKIRSKYLEILRNDPCLPRELLPEVWYRDKVEKELKRMR